jgi:hypothetical protein
VYPLILECLIQLFDMLPLPPILLLLLHAPLRAFERSDRTRRRRRVGSPHREGGAWARRTDEHQQAHEREKEQDAQPTELQLAEEGTVDSERTERTVMR